MTAKTAKAAGRDEEPETAMAAQADAAPEPQAAGKPRTTGRPKAADQPGAEADPDPATIDYEKCVAELADIVRKLEAGDVPLSAAMELWERGEKLASACTAWLDGAKARVDAARKAPPDEGPGDAS